MRKLFAFNMVSLDGFFEGPDHDLSWHNVDEEFNQFAIQQTSSVDTLIFGRVTYELMAGYWPTSDALADDPVVAGLMNNLPKIVFSTTLTSVDWNNTRLVKEDVAGEITALKNQSGKDLAVFGSANLLSTLIRLDLVDEHRIMLSPVVLGSGTPLFQGIRHHLNLKLVDTRTFSSGNVLLTYQPVR